MIANIPKILLRDHVATRCGHTTKRRGVLKAFGQQAKVRMPVNELGSVDWCLDCISDLTIRCAFCGNAIFIGEPITLHTPPKTGFQTPAHAYIYKNIPLLLVGCIACQGDTKTEAHMDYYWTVGDDDRGFVHKVPAGTMLRRRADYISYL